MANCPKINSTGSKKSTRPGKRTRPAMRITRNGLMENSPNNILPLPVKRGVIVQGYHRGMCLKYSYIKESIMSRFEMFRIGVFQLWMLGLALYTGYMVSITWIIPSDNPLVVLWYLFCATMIACTIVRISYW